MATKTKERKTVARKVRRPEEAPLVELPEPDADGRRPAKETMLAILARNIAGRRRQAGLSQAALAQKAGVRQETVSRIESGKHSPTIRTVEKIERALSAAGF